MEPRCYPTVDDARILVGSDARKMIGVGLESQHLGVADDKQNGLTQCAIALASVEKDVIATPPPRSKHSVRPRGPSRRG